MGTKWSQHRRKNSSTLSVKSKKRSPSAETSQVSADAAFPGCAVQRKSCKPQHEFLTDDEQTALVKSWEVIKSSDLQLIGIKVLTRIFEIEPETKQTFPNFRNLTLGELLENPKFKSHAIRFMRAVEVTMENLNALDVIIIPNLKHLGQLHTDISGFKLSYLKAVEIAMDETWETIHEGKPIVVKGYKGRTTPTTPTTPTSNNNNNNYDIDDKISSGISTTTGVYDQLTRCAWMKIFHLITSKIMEGYHEGVEVKLAKEMSKVKEEGTPSGSPKEVNVPHTQQHHQQQLEKTNQQVGSVVLASLQCHSNRRHDNGNQGRCVVGDDGDDDDDDDIPVVQSSGGPLSKDDEKSQGNHHRQQQQYHHHHQQQQHQQHHYQPHKINNGDLTQKSEVTCIKRNNINNNFVKVVPFCPASGNGPI